MAIQAINSMITTKELQFERGGRKFKAEFTPELDIEFPAMVKQIKGFDERIDDLMDSDDTTEVVKAKYKQINQEMIDISKEYIKAAYGDEQAEALFKLTGGRPINYSTIVQKTATAGIGNSLEESQGNREQRRANKG